MLDALVRIAGATTIVNTAKGFSENDVTQAPIQEQVTLGGEIRTKEHRDMPHSRSSTAIGKCLILLPVA